jgi:opacity protein-like surface antigen
MIIDCRLCAKWAILSSLSLSAQLAFALSDSPIKATSTLFTPNIITLSAGPAWENGGDSQTFYLNPGVEKTYHAYDSTNTLADGELFIGKQWALRDTLQAQLGVAFAATSYAGLSGEIWDDASSEFNNYTYKYKIEHTHVAVKGKLLGDWGYIVTPWISMSLGLGFNRAQSFYSTPVIFEAVETPDFQNNTEMAFTYTIGAGVQYALNNHWQVGAGYEFADWGKSELAAAPGQTMGNGLSLDHLYTNALMMNLTYIS